MKQFREHLLWLAHWPFFHFGTEQGDMGAQCTMSTRSGFLGELDFKRKRPLHQQVLAHVGCDELILVCGV